MRRWNFEFFSNPTSFLNSSLSIFFSKFSHDQFKLQINMSDSDSLTDEVLAQRVFDCMQERPRVAEIFVLLTSAASSPASTSPTSPTSSSSSSSSSSSDLTSSFAMDDGEYDEVDEPNPKKKLVHEYACSRNERLPKETKGVAPVRPQDEAARLVSRVSQV